MERKIKRVVREVQGKKIVFEVGQKVVVKHNKIDRIREIIPYTKTITEEKEGEKEISTTIIVYKVKTEKQTIIEVESASNVNIYYE